MSPAKQPNGPANIDVRRQLASLVSERSGPSGLRINVSRAMLSDHERTWRCIFLGFAPSPAQRGERCEWASLGLLSCSPWVAVCLCGGVSAVKVSPDAGSRPPVCRLQPARLGNARHDGRSCGFELLAGVHSGPPCSDPRRGRCRRRHRRGGHERIRRCVFWPMPPWSRVRMVVWPSR